VKLAIIVSHPIQYYSPWFKYLTKETELELKVFYLWNYGISKTFDRDFKTSITWKVSLLDGYSYEFVKNISANPGTHHFYGLNNPELVNRILLFNPDFILIFGYYFYSHFKVFFSNRLKKIPKILRGDSHRLYHTDRAINSAKEILINKILKNFQAGLYVGKANKDYLFRHGFTGQSIFFSPHAVDNTRFYPDYNSRAKYRKLYGISDRDVAIFFCGKFEPKKCPCELGLTFHELTNKRLKLYYVGSGVLEGRLKKIAENDKRIKLIGFVDQSEMPKIYNTADYVILPSFGSGETWGFCLHEALSCGARIIASSHVGSAQDLIEDGKNGYVFPAGNWSELRKIFSLIDSEHTQQSNPLNNYFDYLKNYNYKTATDGLLAAIQYLSNEK
jgi:glycosyltransferase involved in cell wall biosynthesis